MVKFSSNKNKNRSRRRGQRQQRRLLPERLEDRRLLAIGEGSEFSLPTQTIDTTAILGNLTSEVRWGDGTTTSQPVSTPPAPNGRIKIEFRYDLDDTNRFFADPKRRQLLNDVGKSISRHLNDRFLAINPSGTNTWIPQVRDPETGQLRNIDNILQNVPADTIIIYAGGRNLPGATRGEGGPGGFPASNGVFGTKEWVDRVLGRGQAGALGTDQTDFSTWGGSIAFDTAGTDWYFGCAPDSSDKTDFMTVAAHELLHVLGYGLQFLGNTDSAWENLVAGTTFRGPEAKRVYNAEGLAGFPPLDNKSSVPRSHWSETLKENGLPTLMPVAIPDGARQLMTRLDLASLDDIGWDVLYTDPVTVEGSHVYADNADEAYNVDVLVTGSVFGQHGKTTSVEVENVAPRLTVPAKQTVIVGETLDLPEELWEIVDPGFDNDAATPPTVETLQFTIDWDDGSELESGDAIIVQAGDDQQPTKATLSLSHQFDEVGNYDAVVTVTDDDGESDQKTFRIEVIAPPELTLSLRNNSVDEDGGAQATTLTIRRSGPARSTDQVVTLQSSDTSEAVVPSTATILADRTSVTVDVEAKEDTLLDGTQSVTLTASGSGLVGDEVTLDVLDAEELVVSVGPDRVLENGPGPLINVRRSNTDNGAVVDVDVRGGDRVEATVPEMVMVRSGANSVNFRPQLINDDDQESPQLLTYTFTAAGYRSATLSFTLLDDEPPLFQNQVDRFDVNDVSGVTSNDALIVVNALGTRQSADLNPESESPDGVFLDVNGDYKTTALDALLIINELGRRFLTGEPEQVALSTSPLPDTLDEEDELLVDLVFGSASIF